jgi:hypothetical protein
MNERARFGSGYPLRCPAAGCDPTIQRQGELERDVRKPLRDELRPRCDDAARLRFADPLNDKDPCRAKLHDPAPFDVGVRIAASNDDTRDFRVHDRVRARRRTTSVIARFERHVERAAGRGAASVFERGDLGVVFTGPLVPTLSDDYAVTNDHGPYVRIR